MNCKIRVFISAAFLAFMTTGPLCAASRFFDPQTMMPASQIQRGMKAVGRTVFEGTKICEFNLEVMGVLEQANLGHELIIMRVTDGPVVERQSGIIGGMSGSPVYINGKLIGAVAYGWGFPKEPICGVTSIDSMLEGLETETKKPSDTASLPQRFQANSPLYVGGRQVFAARVASPGETQPFADASTLNLRPVAPLVYCSGMTSGGMSRLKKLFAPYGIEPLEGPGGKKEPVPTELVPGAAVAVRLMTGDFDAAGIGTVTYRTGDRILAFGHPMMQMGSVAMPLGTAWIYDFIPSYQRSNKLGSAMQTVGTLTMDCPWSIGGTLGKTAPTVPADFRIVDETRGITRTFHVDITNERALASELAVSAAASALEATFNTSEEGIATVKFQVEGDKGDKITRKDRFYHTGNVAQAAMSDMAGAMQLLNDNRFTPQKIKRVSMEASLSPKPDVALIEKLYAEENVARAGEKLTLHAVIRPEGKEKFEKIIQLDLPKDLPKGSMRVGVSGGTDSWPLRQRLGLLMPEFDNLKDVIKLIEQQEYSTELFAAAALPTTGLSVGGTRLMHLPPAIETIIAQSPRTDMARGKSEISQKMDTGYVLLGREIFTIATADREGAKGAPVAPPKAKEGDKEETSSVSVRADATPLNVAGAPQQCLEQQDIPHYVGVPDSLWWAASAFLRPMTANTAPIGGADAASGTPRIRIQRANTLSTAKPDKSDAEKPKDKSDASGDEAKKPTEKAKEDDKASVTRQPQTWVQTTRDDFQNGDADGVAIFSDGTVALSPKWTRTARVDNLYIWAVAASKSGDIYLGTGSPGKVYRYADGKLSLVYDTGEFMVHSLAVDEQGNIWAGTAPEGKVFRISPDGQGKLLTKIPASYVWALCPDGKGGFYAGTGPKGGIFQIGADGSCKQLLLTSQAHVTSLVMAGGRLYAGTAEKGVVYRMTPGSGFEAVLDAGEANITALATDDAGKVYAATAPKGAIYAISPDGSSEKVYDNEKQAIMSLAWVQGALYAGTGDEGRIFAYLGDDRSATLHDDKDAAFITCLCTDGKGGVWAGTANPGTLLSTHNEKPADGLLKSAVLDAKRVSAWGKIDWRSTVPNGTAIRFATRSGNSTDPDDGSWSAWSRDYERPGEERVSSPAARFLQYRIQMHKPEGHAVPTVQRVAISYLTANQKPDVSFSAPDDGQAIRKEFELKWKMTDPDKDTLLATVAVQKQGTKDWQVIKAGTNQESFKWDTTKVGDGVYQIRVTVTDAASNAIGALSDVTLPRYVIVDNSLPDLRIDTTIAQLDAGKPVTISGRAQGMVSRIIAVEWRFADQDVWHAAAAADGMFDGLYETFTLTTEPIAKGGQVIMVRARNAAGGTTELRVPAAKDGEVKEVKAEAKG